jgi:ATP-dependent Clp protease ATP-binding subunit ClpX
VLTTVEPLDEDALVRILTEPRNALVRQYKRMFEIDDVELEFTDEALNEIATLAVERKTGARGLRAILEEVLGPIMFDIPSREDVGTVEITADVVRKNAAPTIVPKPPKAVPNEKSA